MEKGQNISVVIPSVRDPRLQDTIDSLTENADSELEIIVQYDDDRTGLRDTVNKAVERSTGDYILKTDDHCMFGPHWDTILLNDIKDHWIVVPRRFQLDTDKWEVMDDPPIDIERLVINQPGKIGGTKWRSRSRKRKDIMVDETMIFQGSCYFMSRKHWNWLGGLNPEGYGQFSNEPVELALKTWLGGGKVMVNKNTWYAHKHRKFGRIYSPPGVRQGNRYSEDYWKNDRWEHRKYDINCLMERFGL